MVVGGGYAYNAQDTSRSVRAFALVEDHIGGRRVLPMVAVDGEDQREPEDDETAEAAMLPSLELVSEMDKAEVFGWRMATEGDVQPYGQPRH